MKKLNVKTAAIAAITCVLVIIGMFFAPVKTEAATPERTIVAASAGWMEDRTLDAMPEQYDVDATPEIVIIAERP